MLLPVLYPLLREFKEPSPGQIFGPRVKYQWDFIHNPKNKLLGNWGEDEEEGESVEDKIIKIDEFQLKDQDELFVLQKRDLLFYLLQEPNKEGQELKTRKAKWQINEGDKSEYSEQYELTQDLLTIAPIELHAYFNFLINNKENVSIKVNLLDYNHELPIVINQLSNELKQYFQETKEILSENSNSTVDWMYITGLNEEFAETGVNYKLSLDEEFSNHTLTIPVAKTYESKLECYKNLVLIDYKENTVNSLIKEEAGEIIWQQNESNKDQLDNLIKYLEENIKQDIALSIEEVQNVLKQYTAKFFGITINLENE